MILRTEEPPPTNISSISFMLYFFINFLINLYQSSGRNAPSHSQAHWPQMKPAALNSVPLSPRVRPGMHACRLQALPMKTTLLILLQDMLLAMKRIERCFCGSLFTNSCTFLYYTGFVFPSILLLWFSNMVLRFENVYVIWGDCLCTRLVMAEQPGCKIRRGSLYCQ